MPTVANGNGFDGDLANAREDNVELTVAGPHEAVIRPLHVRHFGTLYGSLGTVIILPLWFYPSGIATLVGGEIDVIQEDAATGQRVAGVKTRSQRAPPAARGRSDWSIRSLISRTWWS